MESATLLILAAAASDDSAALTMHRFCCEQVVLQLSRLFLVSNMLKPQDALAQSQKAEGGEAGRGEKED